MKQSSKVIPAAAVRGAASGVLFMAFFGTLWAGIGIGGLQGWGFPLLQIIALLIGAALAVGGLMLLRSARKMPNRISESDAKAWKRRGIWFGVIFAAEGILIGAASGICSAINQFNLFFPIMAIIVGVHFLPLAALFRVRAHYVTGTLLSLLGLCTLLFVPETGMIAGHPIIVWWSVTGFGSALILWGTGFVLWLLGKQFAA